MEEKYINQCSSKNRESREYTKYGFIDTYKVNGAKVVMEFHQYANGEDDYDDELVSVKVEEKSLLQNLKDLVALNPMDLLGNENN